jgi:hypothetical protein
MTAHRDWQAVHTRATEATQGSWTPAGKGFKTVMVTQEYRQCKRVDDQEAGPVGEPWAASVTWLMRLAAPGMAYHSHYRQNHWYRSENFDLLIPTLHRYHVRHQSFNLRYPFIPILLYDILPDIESKLRYCIHINCTKNVEIEYRTRYRRFLFDIDTLSSVQRASVWSVLNIVPDIVYYIDVNI